MIIHTLSVRSVCFEIARRARSVMGVAFAAALVLLVMVAAINASVIQGAVDLFAARPLLWMAAAFVFGSWLPPLSTPVLVRRPKARKNWWG